MAIDTQCPVCRDSNTGFYFEKETSHGTFSIRRCAACGSAMVLPRPSQSKMDHYYAEMEYGLPTLQAALETDQSYYPDSDIDARRIIAKCTELAQGKQFLDVGSGIGKYSQYAVAAGFDVTALEPNTNSAKHFTRLNEFDPIQAVFDRNIARSYKASMDVVLLSQVLEHICDLDNMVSCLNSVLKARGIAAIAVPHYGSILSKMQGRRDMYISPPEHVNYFSVDGLDRLFERNGFERVALETVSKVPKAKLEQKLTAFNMGSLMWRLAYKVLRLAEPFNKGMIINAYYRKRSGVG